MASFNSSRIRDGRGIHDETTDEEDPDEEEPLLGFDPVVMTHTEYVKRKQRSAKYLHYPRLVSRGSTKISQIGTIINELGGIDAIAKELRTFLRILTLISFSFLFKLWKRYGYYSPTTIPANILVVIQVAMGVVNTGIITGFIFAKISRPSRMRASIMFSDLAVINKNHAHYSGSVDQLESGTWIDPSVPPPPNQFHSIQTPEIADDVDCPCLIIRVANAFKTQIIDPKFHLLLIQRKIHHKASDSQRKIAPPGPTRGMDSSHMNSLLAKFQSNDLSSIDTSTESDVSTPASFDTKYNENRRILNQLNAEEEGKWIDYTVQELHFELNKQVGRVRSVSLSIPLMPLPWTIVHPLDRHSPLRGATPESLAASRAELVAIVDGVNEAVGDNFQARWSYIASEIVWGADFVPMVKIKNGEFEIDYTRISEITPVPE